MSACLHTSLILLFQIVPEHTLKSVISNICGRWEPAHQVEHILPYHLSLLQKSPSFLPSCSDRLCPEQSLEISLWGRVTGNNRGLVVKTTTKFPLLPSFVSCPSSQCSSSASLPLPDLYPPPDTVFFWMRGHFNQPFLSPPTSLL